MATAGATGTRPARGESLAANMSARCTRRAICCATERSRSGPGTWVWWSRTASSQSEDMTPMVISMALDRSACDAMVDFCGAVGLSNCSARRSCKSVMARFMVNATLRTCSSCSAGHWRTSLAARPHITLTSMACVALYMRGSVADRWINANRVPSGWRRQCLRNWSCRRPSFSRKSEGCASRSSALACT